MLFSSSSFILFFLPIVLLLYFITPVKYRNLLLLIFSIYFYAYGEKFFVLVMLFSTIVNYSCGRLIEKGYRKLGLIIALIISLGALCYFKYFNFGAENLILLAKSMGFNLENFSYYKIILPLGISFYTFQTLSYTIDVYRNNIKATHSFVEFATYVTLFPQLVAGPIVRYVDIAQQLKQRFISLNDFSSGVERFIIGLVKKMLIANTFALVADTVFNAGIENITTGAAWVGILAYTFQIYFDFSAYSDMAIGLGRMFGFHFLENFNYPYISRSIKEFWRRWHISLSTWFRDYLYIPLGGNRISVSRTYLNLFIVFLATGFWHGASWNFIVWGLIHGLLLIVERIGFDRVLSRLWTPLQHIYTLLCVVVAWVFFRADNMSGALQYLKKMFSCSVAENNITAQIGISYLINNEVIIMTVIAIAFSMPLFPKLRTAIADSKFMILYYITLIILFCVALLYINSSTYNPFIYFRF